MLTAAESGGKQSSRVVNHTDSATLTLDSSKRGTIANDTKQFVLLDFVLTTREFTCSEFLISMSHVIRHFTGSLGNYFAPTRELIFFFNLSFISLLQFRGSMEIIFNVVDDKIKRPFSILFFF